MSAQTPEDRRRIALSPFSGKFINRQLENEFRQGIWPVWNRRARALVLAGITAYLITTLVDYLLLGTGILFVLTVAGRLLVAAYGLSFIALAARRQSPHYSDLGMLVFWLLLISLFLATVAVRPDGMRYSGPAVVLILCVLYAMPMTRLWITQASTLYLSLGILAVAQWFKHISLHDIGVLSIQLLAINALGLFITLRLHQDMRLAWVNQQSLREREAQFEALASVSPVGIFQADAEGLFQYVNERWIQMTGLSREESLGDRWQQAIHPDDLERVRAQWRESVSEKTRFEAEYRNRKPDDIVLWVRSASQPHLDADGKLLGFIGAVDDITTRKNAQLDLEQRARLDECVSSLGKRFLRQDDSEATVVVQHALADVGEFAGADRCVYFEINAQESTIGCRYRWLRSEAEVKFESLSLLNLPIADYGWCMPQILRGEIVYIPQVAALPANAINEREKLEANSVLSLLLVPIQSAGKVVSFMSLSAVRAEMNWSTDNSLLMRIAGEMILNTLQREENTESQRQHIRELEVVNLELDSRNVELKKLAYVASHDLQEPLRAVSSFSSLLAQKYQGQLDTEADEYIGFITDASARLQQMINDLLTYTRIDEQIREPVECNLDEVSRITQDNLADTIKSLNARIEFGKLPSVLADPLQMIELLQQLLANALHFHSDDPPRIKIDAIHKDDTWVISVTDNGVGIPPEHAERVFDVFRRLHIRDQHPGNGIGLAICRRIVERHGGHIWVEPNQPHGSVFYFTLPSNLHAGKPLHHAA